MILHVTYSLCLSMSLKISFSMWNLEACDGIPKGQSEMDADYKLHSTGASVIWSHFGLWLRNDPLTPHFVRWISLCHSGLTVLIITTPPRSEKAVRAWHRAPNLIPFAVSADPQFWQTTNKIFSLTPGLNSKDHFVAQSDFFSCQQFYWPHHKNY